MPWDYLLGLLDYYKVDNLPIKGSTMAWRPKKVVFTCPRPPEEEFSTVVMGARRTNEDIEQLQRRIDVVVHATAAWTYDVTKG